MNSSRETNEQIWAALLKPQHSPGAVARLANRATAGDAEAQWLYAQWLSWDQKLGFRPASGRALAWLKRAASASHPHALVELGHIVWKRSKPQALAMYRRAAEQGDPVAHWNLGLALETEATPKALASARHHYAACAELLAPYAWKIGEFELFGLGGRRNLRSALGHFRRAARDGKSPEAETYLGIMAESGIASQRNQKRAIRWYERAAANRFSDCEHGDPIALLRLAILRQKSGDEEDALDIANRAAAGGLPSAMALAASLLAHRGATGRAQATRAWRRAQLAERGWRARFQHWRAIDDHHDALMSQARRETRR